MQALGGDTGITESEVSRICAKLDEAIAAFLDRPLGAMAFPHVVLDATCCKARANRWVVSQAVMFAIRYVTPTGSHL